MASLRKKDRSNYWYACYFGADGSRRQISTKQTNRKKAQALADAWEKAAKLGSEKRLGEAQARRIVADIYETLNDAPLTFSSAHDFLTNWAEKQKPPATAPRTHAAYAQIARDFIESLGNRAAVDISQVSATDVARYRDAVATRTSAATAHKALKYLRIAFGAAMREGLTQTNPAAQLVKPKTTAAEKAAKVSRRALTVDEIRAVLRNASGEWRGIILIGFYCGQRLKDIARLTWANVDSDAGVFRFTTAKTGKKMEIPIDARVSAYLAEIPSPSETTPNAPLFPEAYKIGIKNNGDSRLSQQFHEILAAAGLVEARESKLKAEAGKGRSHARKVNEISFHSLRHSATTELKQGGAGEAVAMGIIGHDSSAVSRHYTHISPETMRPAIARLPDIST